MLLFAGGVAAIMGHLGAVGVRAMAASRGTLLDVPGAARLHRQPIPRGGGIGIAFAWLLIGIAPNLASPGIDGWREACGWLAAALALVAVIGWVDDHRGLPAWPRLVVHLAAAACVAAAWNSATVVAESLHWLFAAVVIVATTASINLHNFLDGADGMLSWQVLFVALFIALLALFDGHLPLAMLAVAAAGGIAGFLPHNVPSARLFMGDVGSGVLGLIVAALGALAVRDGVLSWQALLVLVSGCLIDTGMTLATRALLGRRFWRRHHQHLYQWLIRSGWSHPRTALAWMSWNVVIVLPAVILSLRMPARAGSIAAIVYALGMAIWLAGKRRILASARGRG